MRLRPLLHDDYEHLIDIALNEPETWEYSLVSASGKTGLKNYIATALATRQAEKEYAFIVFDKQLNRYTGSTRYYDIALADKTLEIGYTWYSQASRGTGLNKHCKYLLLSFAFEQLQIERVAFRADNENQRSIAAMKSIGCTVEGILRSDRARADGSRRNSIILSILKSEWEDDVKTNLQRKL